LERATQALGLDAVIIPKKVEAVTGKYDIITGRAVAPLGRFFSLACHLSHPQTVWLLPKGRNAQSELEQARRNWHCEVGEEPSCTDPESTILRISKVRRR
jgi:16S rRNA (guanine527-N7)-methyltransferase